VTGASKRPVADTDPTLLTSPLSFQVETLGQDGTAVHPFPIYRPFQTQPLHWIQAQLQGSVGQAGRVQLQGSLCPSGHHKQLLG